MSALKYQKKHEIAFIVNTCILNIMKVIKSFKLVIVVTYGSHLL